MNIYLHELKAMRKSTIIWVLSMIALAALYLSIFPSFAKDAEDVKSLLGAYPAPVREALGISIDNITSMLGFYSMVFSFISLCGAIQAMNMGLSILSKESRERTADFLLVKPVSRTAIVTSKLLSALTMLVITNVVYYGAVSLLASAARTEAYDLKAFFLINLSMLLLQLILLSIGLVISVFFSKLKAVLPISLGVVFGFFIVGALIATENSETARYLSPFKYFDLPYIISHRSYEASFLGAGALIVVAAILTSYIIYTKKDIHAVS